MEKVRTLIVGAGITGLATAAALAERGDDDYLVLEADAEIGGYCKTVKKDGFVWDYSGHFFHFKHPEIEAWLRERMPGQDIRTVEKKSFIAYTGDTIDFPFQKNIHQLPQEEFIDCLHDLYFARAPRAPRRGAPPTPRATTTSRRCSTRASAGRSPRSSSSRTTRSSTRCDLGTLDKDAMGRFFPHADLTDIVRNMKVADNATYNATFTYPEGGAIEYVKALASAVRPGAHRARASRSSAIDLDAQGRAHDQARDRASSASSRRRRSTGCSRWRACRTTRRSSPGTRCSSSTSASTARARRTSTGSTTRTASSSFYRVGFYDNIFDTDRLSLYVELGFPKDAVVDVAAMRERVLADLEARGRHHGPSRSSPSTRRDGSGVRAHHAALARRARAPRGRAPRARRATRSAATAAGPTAPSRTTSSRRARSFPRF